MKTENIKNIALIVIAGLYLFNSTRSCEKKETSILEQHILSDNKRLQTVKDSVINALSNRDKDIDSLINYVVFLKEEIVEEHEEIRNLKDINAIDSVYLEYKRNRPGR